MTGRAERRYTAVPVEARGGDGNNDPKIGGYAAKFNRMSQNLGGFVEIVSPRFFNQSRADGWPDVMARYNHDDNQLLGTTGAGTLSLFVDEQGLGYEVVVPRSLPLVFELVTRGDVRKSSFAFRVFDGGDEWTMSEQNYPLRTLMNGQLVDVAPVNSPAYIDTTVGKRAEFVLPEARGALESLALKMEAPLEDVLTFAKENDLRRFFVRTDTHAPTIKPLSRSSAAALLASRMAENAI